MVVVVEEDVVAEDVLGLDVVLLVEELVLLVEELVLDVVLGRKLLVKIWVFVPLSKSGLFGDSFELCALRLKPFEAVNKRY